MIPMRNKLGRFKLPVYLIEKFDTSAKRIMGQCIVVRAEHMFHADAIEYFAISEHFRAIEPNELPPWYDWVISPNGHLSCVEFDPYTLRKV